MNAEKLAKLQAQVRTGGKGTARRKKKVVHKTAATDDKKLQVRTFKFNVSVIITSDISILQLDNLKSFYPYSYFSLLLRKYLWTKFLALKKSIW